MIRKWCQRNPDRHVEFIICGEGANKQAIADCHLENFRLDMRGHCDQDQLREAYRVADVCLFPSLADEWGLVPIEAMASGLPVIGASYAQSVESLIEEGVNGWSFRPDVESEFLTAFSACMGKSSKEIYQMGETARRSIEHITPERSAECFVTVIEHALANHSTANS